MVYPFKGFFGIQRGHKTVLPRAVKYSTHWRNTKTACEHPKFLLKPNCRSLEVTRTFTGSHLRAVTDDDDDNARHHSTTTRATYRQKVLVGPHLAYLGLDPVTEVCETRPTVTFPAVGNHCRFTGIKLYCLVTEGRTCVWTTCPRSSPWNSRELNARSWVSTTSHNSM